MRIRIHVINFTVCLLLLSCSSAYKKEDAIRSLKVLNSDILNLLTVSSDLHEFKTLKFLYNQPNSPVPFKKSEFKSDSSAFTLKKLAGTYVWDSGLNDFDFKKDKSFIDVHLLLPGMDSMCFQILDYESEAYSSSPDFPTKITAKVIEGTNEKLVINHVGNVRDNLPGYMETNFYGDGYKVKAGFKRTKESGDGTINSFCSIKKGVITIVDAKLFAQISYSLQGFYYNYIEFESRVFNHTISGEIDYKNIEPTSTNYAESFNRNSSIQIYESPSKKVGDIILVNSEQGNLQEFKIQFKNKDQVLLKEYLPVIDKLYNLKY